MRDALMWKRSLRHRRSREDLMARIRHVTPDSARRWGEMPHANLFAHLGDALRLALGEIVVCSSAADARFAAQRRVWIYELPWPEGKVQAPKEGFFTVPQNWEADRESLLALVRWYAEVSPDKLASVHPLLGEMAPEDWDVLMFRHLDHHLRQFSA